MDIRQLKFIQQNFLKELQDASKGKKTSLPFIEHRIPSASIIENGESFQVMVIGGSVFKKALLKRVGDDIEIIRKEDEKQLSIKNESDFLSFIDQELDDKVNTLAINFAYPIQPVFENGKLDGVLLAVTKEGGFHGLVGKKIGKEIEDYVLAKRNKKVKVAVVNDTVCLLTSGLAQFQEEELAAGIVGTGLNFAFFLDKDRIVNLESANFDKFPLSDQGRIIDQQSVKHGRALFEKEIAGAYLYKHFNLKENGINYPQIASTEELDIVSHKDIPQASEIARSLFVRSAQLVSYQIAGITEFKKHSMVFNMEGSLFWKGNHYKETVEETVRQLVPKYNVKFVEIEESGILGAAKLVA